MTKQETADFFVTLVLALTIPVAFYNGNPSVAWFAAGIVFARIVG